MQIYGVQRAGPDGKPLPLSSAIEVNGLIYLSGQIALQDGEVRGGIVEQTNFIFDAISATLENAGLSLNHIAKVTVWLTSQCDFPDFNAVYRERLVPPYPARSCVISPLVLPNACVEIEVIASRASTR